jgi:hypothetical protein
MSRQNQQSEDVKTLLRALVNLKAAALRQRERDSVAAAAALEDAVAAAERADHSHRLHRQEKALNCRQLGLAKCIELHSGFLSSPCGFLFLLLHRILLCHLSMLSSYQQRRQPW